MLSHCANAKCSKPFLRLREGKLFVVEAGRFNSREAEYPPGLPLREAQQRIERYWLCDSCAAVWTLIFDRHDGVRLVPLPRPVASVPAAMAAKSSTA